MASSLSRDPIEEKYPLGDSIMSMTTKDWAVGSHQSHLSEYLVFDNGVPQMRRLELPPALGKIVDELLVNAFDHFVRMCGTKTCVSKISLSFDINPLKITVQNDGEGIDVVEHPGATKKFGSKMYIPTLIFGHEFQGSNTKAGKTILGGTNGIGAKCANSHSTMFLVETIDGIRKLKFTQIWNNHMREPQTPIITKCDDQPYTRVEFVPDLSLFAEHSPADFEKSLYGRFVLASTYCSHYASHSKCIIPKFSYNDVLVGMTLSNLLSMMYPGVEIVREVVPAGNYSWEVSVVLTKGVHMTNVNGIVVPTGGHIDAMMKSIIEESKKTFIKSYNASDVRNVGAFVRGKICIWMNCIVCGPSWSGQTKNCLQINASACPRLSQATISRIVLFLQKQFDTTIKTTVRSAPAREKVACSDKYLPAEAAGSKDSQKCALIAVEGDSAMSQVKLGISKHFGFRYYGVFSLGGCILNVQRTCEVEVRDNSQYVHISKKFDENKVIQTLFKICNLNKSLRYDPTSPTYKKEMSSLNYGSIIACVDQDLDGMGKILGLLLNAFITLWPHLVETGYVRWFSTPIIRAYPAIKSKPVRSFYTKAEYLAAAAELDRGYEIRYYKGLGTHDRDENIAMFKHFQTNTIQYTSDENSKRLFEIYFSDVSELRKTQLSKPIQEISPDLELTQRLTKTISCSDHLLYSTDAFQRSDLVQKLNHVIDGNNESSRKILDGSLRAFAGGNHRMKVAQLAADVSRHKGYLHGEGSLAKSITGKAFIAPGGKQLPIFVPLSNFGSREHGGADAAQPRYTYTKLNKPLCDLLFPEDDYHLLDFVVDGGERLEPKYFVPIIPLAITESAHVPSHGWKLETWARCVFSVISKTIDMIYTGEVVGSLRICDYAGSPYAYNGKFKKCGPTMYSIGTYEIIAADTVRITELPLRMWTAKYITKYLAKLDTQIVEKFTSNCADMKIDILVYFRPGALETVMNTYDNGYLDGVEKYLSLAQPMHTHLNLIAVDGSVLECKEYEEVFAHWFPVRKQLYQKRLERKRVILGLKIRVLENLIRYIESRKQIGNHSIAEMERLLEESKYEKFNYPALTGVGFTETDKIEDVVLRKDASYDYILNLTEKKKSTENLAKLTHDVENLRKLLDQVEKHLVSKPFPGATLWLQELNALHDVIAEGQKTFWLYGEANVYKFE